MYRTAPSSGPTCSKHPVAPAIAQCADCQAHVCTPCGLYRELKLVCPTCAKKSEARGAGKTRFGQRIAAGAAIALAGVTASMGMARYRDPHNWRAHRPAIESLLAQTHAHPCAAPPLHALVGEMVDAGDMSSAGLALDRALEVCRFPASIHELAYKVHMNLHQFDAAAHDAQRRIGLDGRDRLAYVDLARAYDRAGEPSLAVKADLAALVLDCKDTSAFMRVKGRAAAMGDRARVAEVAAIEKKCAQGTAEDEVAEIDLPLMQMAARDPVDGTR